uniref:Uncharacterized protein n=1 Tax=Siphoviridae sp. ctiJm4 TaxID=2827916 RepID=A0A8S5T1G0_9CAUD|nr:MAG TPA: hypothetical protein [Siphoviridae sp. ctiJm4]
MFAVHCGLNLNKIKALHFRSIIDWLRNKQSTKKLTK